MKKNLRCLFLGVFFFFATLVFPFQQVRAQQAWGPSRSDKIIDCVGSSDYGAQDVPTIKGVECLVANLLAAAVTLIGIVAFVMFLIGGFRYLTAGSNSKGVESGKNTIGFAILGIVVALASYLILNVISSLTGVTTIKTFRIQQFNPDGNSQ